ncbi:MAG TPA: O-antigen ligase family protein [Actinomycetota bacterium]|nr:O-antigen ligase family protein [Actinomycetota bacterium]
MEPTATHRSTARSLRDATRRGNITAPVLVVVVAAIAAGSAAAAGASRTEISIPLIAAAGLALAWLGSMRFTYFVAAILFVRASLDAVKLSTTGTTAADPAAIVSIVFLLAGALWLLIQPADERAPRSPLVAPLVMLALVGAFSTASSANAVSGLVDAGKLITVAVMLAVLNQVFSTERDVRIVVAAAFGSAAIPLGVALVQYPTETGFHYSDGFARLSSTFNHPNPFGIYLSFLIIMGAAILPYLTSRVQIALVWLMAGCGLALLATYTRSAWIAAIVGIVIVTWFISRRVMVAVLVIGAVLALTVPDISARFSDLDDTVTQSGAAGNSLVWRVEYWRQALDLNDDPLLGSGLSAVRVEGSEAKEPHNDFIRVYVETGLLGLAAYLWFLWAAAKVALEGIRRTRDGFLRGVTIGFAGIIATYVVLSLVSNVITQLALLWYVGAFAAAAVAAPRLAPREEPEPVVGVDA